MKALKFLMIPFAALAMACSGSDDPITNGSDNGGNEGNGSIERGELVLSVNPGLIVADGADKAVFTATLDGTAVTGFTVYDSSDTPIEGTEFTTTKAGTYTFWASYGVNISKKVTLEATEQEVPDLPADSNPSATNFVRRAMITKFTGSGCTWCPYLTGGIHKVETNPDYTDKIVLTANHSFSSNSDAYSDAAGRIANLIGVPGYPYAMVDLCVPVNTSNSVTGDERTLKAALDSRLSQEPVAGISAAASMAGNRVIVRTAVKAGVTGQYRVNVWLVEDGIREAQTGASGVLEGYDFNTHNECIRLSGSSRPVNGESLGEIVAGNIAEQVFVMTLDPEWKKENMRAVVYVLAVENNNAQVVNSVIMGTNDATAFEYAN